MSPHALDPTAFDETLNSLGTMETKRNVVGISDGSHPTESLLQRYGHDEIHDLLCVGFGPASLAIAVALHDELENCNPTLAIKPPKVRFIERQSQFAWHAGMLLPGTKMQITFIKDLATLRNPRSEFTFLNYLHRNSRLVPFTNLGTFLPQRIEYEDYMRWCASHFDDVVDYGLYVQAVDIGRQDPKTGEVQYFQVRAKDQASGQSISHRAKNVVIAVGGKPQIPECLNSKHPRIIHSSQYATAISQIFPHGSAPRAVAIIGAGQSAAEVFHNIPSRFPGSKSYLLIKGSALRPSDDSPFVNEIFDPNRVDDVYSQDPYIRADGLALDRGTNYGVVRLELLEEIYSTLYSYRIQHDQERYWPQQILPHRTVTGMDETHQINGPGVRLHIRNESGSHRAHENSKEEFLNVDLVVVASGYSRNAHEDMLQSLNRLKPKKVEDTHWKVGRDYSIEFERGSVATDAGIWLQGCNEATHGLSDTLLSILATRGGEMVNSIFRPADKPKMRSNGKIMNGH